MVVAENPLAVGQGCLVDPDCLVEPARGLVRAGQAALWAQGLWVVVAENPLAVGQGCLVDPDCLVEPPAAW